MRMFCMTPRANGCAPNVDPHLSTNHPARFLAFAEQRDGPSHARRHCRRAWDVDCGCWKFARARASFVGRDGTPRIGCPNLCPAYALALGPYLWRDGISRAHFGARGNETYRE